MYKKKNEAIKKLLQRPGYEADKKLLQQLTKKKEKRAKEKRAKDPDWKRKYDKVLAESKGITVGQLKKERIAKRKEVIEETKAERKQMEEEYEVAKRMGFQGSFDWWWKIYGTKRFEMMMQKLIKKHEVSVRISKARKKYMERIKDKISKQ